MTQQYYYNFGNAAGAAMEHNARMAARTAELRAAEDAIKGDKPPKDNRDEGLPHSVKKRPTKGR